MTKYNTFYKNVKKLTNHKLYEVSKNESNLKEAIKMVKELVSKEDLLQYDKTYPPGTILVYIQSRESKNVIPEALATLIYDTCQNFEVDDVIGYKKTFSHTSKGDFQMNVAMRTITPPTFHGEVKQGSNYVIIDDVLTTGNTIKSASNYIVKNGGNVLGYGTLATAYKSGYKQASTIDATEENLKLFSDKFGDKGKEEIVNIFKQYKYEKFEEFSDRTLEWFLLFNNTRNIRSRVEDAEKSIYEYKRLQVEEGYKPYQSKSNNSGNSSRNSKKREDIKVIVAGGRDFTNYKFVQDKLDALFRNRKDDSNITILSGTASGTDKLGERYAKNRKYSLKTFPANWKDFGRAAGPIRNTEMVKEGTHLVAFWDGKSKGTADIISKAIKKGIPIRIYDTNKLKFLKGHSGKNNNNTQQTINL